MTLRKLCLKWGFPEYPILCCCSITFPERFLLPFFSLGQAEWEDHSHWAWAPDSLCAGQRPGPLPLHCNREQLQADLGKDQFQGAGFGDGGCHDWQVVPLDLGQLSESTAVPPQGLCGGFQPLRDADDQPVLQGQQAGRSAEGRIPEDERGLQQTKGPYQ